MTAIERTAYPRLRRKPGERELTTLYTPTDAGLVWASNAARDAAHRLHLLLWLKCFQPLGDFPSLLEVPTSIVEHLRLYLDVDPSIPLGYNQDRMLYRHQHVVREYLQVQPFDEKARLAASSALYTAARVMDNPADLINVAIEELVRLRYELPAFSTLDRLVDNVRAEVNQALFAQVFGRLSTADTARLQDLLDTKLATRRTNFQTIKDPPESATVGHLRALEIKLAWLLTLGDTDQLLPEVPAAKLKHFAAEAFALDAGAMNDVIAPKRYTLLLFLIPQPAWQLTLTW